MANKSKTKKISKPSKATVREDKLRECLFCSRIVSSYPQLIIHMNTHNEERPFQCDKCSNSYSDFRYLWNHRRSFHQKLKNKCDKCDYTTTFPTNLQRHKKSCAKILNGQMMKNLKLISVRPIVRKSKSETVEKSGVNSNNVRKAQRKLNISKKPVTIKIPPTPAHSHIGHLKPFEEMKAKKIPYLNKLNPEIKNKRSKKSAQNARAKRASSRKFECLFCSESVPGFDGLTTHINRHTGERPYWCNLCSSTFTSRQPLLCHTASVHLGKQHKCPNCNYFTRFHGNLYNHKRSCFRNQPFKAGENRENGVKEGKPPNEDKSVSVATASPARVPSLDPSKLLNLIKGLDRVSQLKRCEVKEPTKSSDLIPEDKKPAVPSEGLFEKPEVKKEPDVPKEKPKVNEGAGEHSKAQRTPLVPNLEPKPNYPKLVYLPLDDPRSIQVAKQFPSFKQFSSMDLPKQPTNLFFSVNGQVTFPLLSVQYYRAWAPPPSPPPVYPDSDEYLDEDEEPVIQEDNPKVPKPKPKDKHCTDKPISCEICGARFSRNYSLRRHERLLHGKQLKPKDERCIDKPFSCEICGARFSRNYSLRQHGLLLHGEQLAPTPRTQKNTNGQSKPK